MADINELIEHELNRINGLEDTAYVIEEYKKLIYAVVAGCNLAWRETDRTYRTEDHEIRDKINWRYLENVPGSETYHAVEQQIRIETESAIEAHKESKTSYQEQYNAHKEVQKQKLRDAGLNPEEYGFNR